MKVPNTNFKDLSFNISNYCISGCHYCNLNSPKNWHLDDEMSLELIEKVLNDPILDTLEQIHETGGEPYLSPKFIPICNMLYERFPNARMNFPTNALYPRLIERLMKMVYPKLPQFVINFGLEGPNKEIHEAVRGKDTFTPMLETVCLLQDIGVKLQANMSVCKENYKYIENTYNFAKNALEVPFFINFMRFSRRFGNQRDGIMWYGDTEEENEQIINTIDEQLDNIGWKEWRPLNKSKWVIQEAQWRNKDIRWNCLAGIEGIDIYPDGTVHSCLMYNKDYEFGNLQGYSSFDHPLTEIMNTARSKSIQKRIYEGECSKDCPFSCAFRIRNVTVDGKKVDI